MAAWISSHRSWRERSRNSRTRTANINISGTKPITLIPPGAVRQAADGAGARVRAGEEVRLLHAGHHLGPASPPQPGHVAPPSRLSGDGGREGTFSDDLEWYRRPQLSPRREERIDPLLGGQTP